jgi:HSP20 family molecular chaperone IbpA
MPRSTFDMDYWLRQDNLGLSTLDLFDPFDELDRMIGRNFNWLNKPEFLGQTIPKIPNKYRVTLNCSGFSPKSIKTEISNNQLIVTGNEGNKENNNEDFTIKEFRKTFKLPSNTENDKLVSFMTSNGNLVIEIPLKQDEKTKTQNDLFPKISDDKTNVSMNLVLPDNLDPSKLNVVCKDRQLIVKYQNKKETDDTYSDVYFYKQVLLPENTDFNCLKCTYDKNTLAITAPSKSDFKDRKENVIVVQVLNQNKLN